MPHDALHLHRVATVDDGRNAGPETCDPVDVSETNAVQWDRRVSSPHHTSCIASRNDNSDMHDRREIVERRSAKSRGLSFPPDDDVVVIVIPAIANDDDVDVHVNDDESIRIREGGRTSSRRRRIVATAAMGRR